MIEKLLTVDEAAAELKLHAQTVRDHLKAGKLRGIKRGRAWRIPASALFEPEPTDALTQMRREVETAQFNAEIATRQADEVAQAFATEGGACNYNDAATLEEHAQRERDLADSKAEVLAAMEAAPPEMREQIRSECAAVGMLSRDDDGSED